MARSHIHLLSYHGRAIMQALSLMANVAGAACTLDGNAAPLCDRDVHMLRNEVQNAR